MGNRGILVAQVDRQIKSASEIIIKDFSSGIWKSYTIRKL